MPRGWPAGRWAWLLHGLLVLVVAWQMAGIVSVASVRNLEFDGGMNLEVAKSIANGEGPRGRYQHANLYPAGVQSKEPFYLVGAAVFKVAGVGPVQAQMTNVIFLLALVTLIVCVVARATSLLAGLLAACFVLATPRMAFYGLMGYGEIATMCFGLGAIAVVAWPARLDASGWMRAFFAGALAALAIATKVVGVVQFSVVAALLALRVLADADAGTRLRALVRAGLAFAAGALVPLLLIEAWRLHWLGLQGYRDWWNFQILSIGRQSGATPFSPQAGFMQKVPAHFTVLRTELQRAPLATIALLALPLLSAVALGWRQFPRPAPQDAPRTWLSLGLAMVAALYIPWWLGMVPDDKTWVRYLYIALIALTVLGAMGVVMHARAALRGDMPLRRGAHAALAIGLALVFVPFAWRSLPKQRLDASPSPEVQATLYAARLIETLPQDRLVFGYGWYAAPVIQLYVDRPFKDLTDWPIGRLMGKPGYLIADRWTYIVGVIDPILARYPHRMLMRDNNDAQVYEIDFAHPFDPFAGKDTSAVQASVDFADGDYPLVSGYEPWDPIGGRFVTTDSEVLLRYEGQSELQFAAYMGLSRFYLLDEPLRGRVVVDGCPSRQFAFEHTGWRFFRIPLSCRPALHQNVRVRILLDNVFNMPRDYVRQRGMLVRKIGFAG